MWCDAVSLLLCSVFAMFMLEVKDKITVIYLMSHGGMLFLNLCPCMEVMRSNGLCVV